MPRTLAAAVLVALGLAGYALAAGLPGIPRIYQPYKSWTKVNAKPIPNTPTTAHPALLKNVYASKKKVRARYPYGTLVVKEGLTTAGGRRFVSLIAAMRKVRGIDPAHGDWKFTEWSRSSPSARFSLLAKDATCWSCHALAKRNDWVYTKR
ncbi:MAG TPA: cytochrome P460 family protein [Gaiellaceae bacterium]|nr:cytochrome P460 family protein [Gaiellaceae bacterium]